MNAKNNFNPDLRYLFEESWKCMWCGKNTANAQHHIVGRGDKNSDCESSILNCAWLCNHSCHLAIHPQLRSDENIKILLEKTYELIFQSSYILNDIDRAFIAKYYGLYSI